MILKENENPLFNRLFACLIVLVFLVITLLMAKDTTSTSADPRTEGKLGEVELATFGAGCFCTTGSSSGLFTCCCSIVDIHTKHQRLNSRINMD